MKPAQQYPRSFVAVILLTIASYLAGALWVVLAVLGLLAGFVSMLTYQQVSGTSIQAWNLTLIIDIFVGGACALTAFILGVHRQFWITAIFAMVSSLVSCVWVFGILFG